MSDPGGPLGGLTALVLTVSDRSAAGERDDASGEEVGTRLEGLGLVVTREVVPDEEALIAEALVAGAARHRLVITTGGTGLTPRDVKGAIESLDAIVAVLPHALETLAGPFDHQARIGRADLLVGDLDQVAGRRPD